MQQKMALWLCHPWTAAACDDDEFPPLLVFSAKPWWSEHFLLLPFSFLRTRLSASSRLLVTIRSSWRGVLFNWCWRSLISMMPTALAPLMSWKLRVTLPAVVLGSRPVSTMVSIVSVQSPAYAEDWTHSPDCIRPTRTMDSRLSRRTYGEDIPSSRDHEIIHLLYCHTHMITVNRSYHHSPYIMTISSTQTISYK